MTELWHSFLTNRGHVANKWAHYFPIYERHFERFKDTACTVLEIGCDKGGSLQLWKRYFGPNAQIVGIDIYPECAKLEEDQIRIRIGDQSDTVFLQTVIDEIGTPDVVIDDGSHVQRHVRASFDFLYPLVDRRGVYLIEDLHAAYWSNYCAPGESFVEHAKGLIDQLNAYCTEPGPNAFTVSTNSMHFYDSVLVFEKALHSRPRSFITGNANEYKDK